MKIEKGDHFNLIVIGILIILCVFVFTSNAKFKAQLQNQALVNTVVQNSNNIQQITNWINGQQQQKQQPVLKIPPEAYTPIPKEDKEEVK